jgi:hypothetical protein
MSKLTPKELEETFERIRLGEQTPEDWVGLEDHLAYRDRQIAELTEERDRAYAALRDRPFDRSATESLSMSRQLDSWEADHAAAIAAAKESK